MPLAVYHFWFLLGIIFTSSFYLMADLLEIPAVALLVVSDNSATGAALVGRTEEEEKKYDEGRNRVLPDMILTVAEDK